MIVFKLVDVDYWVVNNKLRLHLSLPLRCVKMQKLKQLAPAKQLLSETLSDNEVTVLILHHPVWPAACQSGSPRW